MIISDNGGYYNSNETMILEGLISMAIEVRKYFPSIRPAHQLRQRALL